MFAQLLDYYRYQNWKVAEETWFSGTDLVEGFINREVTVQFADTVNWSLLSRSYGWADKVTEAEENEVAKLMKYAGAALHVMYGIDRTGLYPHQALDRLDAVADYGKHAIFKYAWECPLRTWSEKLYRQLAAGRPVAYNSAGGGHLFLLDGYAGEGMFHFNIGAGGRYDGYYLLTALLPTHQLHLYQSAFFDWCPSYMEPIESHRVLLSGNMAIEKDEQDDFVWKLNLMAFDPQPQSGTLRYTLHVSADAEPITSEPFDFAFTPDADYLSDTLQVPFPAYSLLDQPVYEVCFWQKLGDGWEPLPSYDYCHNWQLRLRRTDTGYTVEWNLPEVELRFAEPSAQLHVHSVDTLTVSWRYTASDLSIGMTADTIQPVLLRQGKEIELPSDVYLLDPSIKQLQLLVSLPSDVEVGERYQLFAKVHSVSCSDTIDVEVRRGPELVLLERPMLPDTVADDASFVVPFRIKNIGEAPYRNGMILLEQGEIPYGQTARIDQIPAGAEVEEMLYFNGFYEPGELLVKLTYWVMNKLTFSMTVRDLTTVDGAPFTHTFYVVEDPTANEQITSIPETTVSWQGRTLCVESALPLKAYHIYNVQGGLVTTGQLSGTYAHIDGSAWPQGVYIVAIKTEAGKTVVYKIRV